jgi:hypothetical protein
MTRRLTPLCAVAASLVATGLLGATSTASPTAPAHAARHAYVRVHLKIRSRMAMWRSHRRLGNPRGSEVDVLDAHVDRERLHLFEGNHSDATFLYGKGVAIMIYSAPGHHLVIRANSAGSAPRAVSLRLRINR